MSVNLTDLDDFDNGVSNTNSDDNVTGADGMNDNTYSEQFSFNFEENMLGRNHNSYNQSLSEMNRNSDIDMKDESSIVQFTQNRTNHNNNNNNNFASGFNFQSDIPDFNFSNENNNSSDNVNIDANKNENGKENVLIKLNEILINFEKDKRSKRNKNEDKFELYKYGIKYEYLLHSMDCLLNETFDGYIKHPARLFACFDIKSVHDYKHELLFLSNYPQTLLTNIKNDIRKEYINYLENEKKVPYYLFHLKKLMALQPKMDGNSSQRMYVTVTTGCNILFVLLLYSDF